MKDIGWRQKHPLAFPTFLVNIHNRGQVIRLGDPLVILVLLEKANSVIITSSHTQTAIDAAVQINPGEFLHRDGVQLATGFTDAAGRALLFVD